MNNKNLLKIIKARIEELKVHKQECVDMKWFTDVMRVEERIAELNKVVDMMENKGE